MAKSIVLGNDNMLVGLDEFGQVYDFYFPYVGLENHTKGQYVHKIGIWVNGIFSWLGDGFWTARSDYQPGTMASDIRVTNQGLGIEIKFEDAVYNESNIFLRKIKVTNLWDEPREIKIYFNQQFIIYESTGGDTAIYDHDNDLIVHYKGRRVFMIDAETNGRCFDDYSVGLLGIEGKEGTFKDAEDGRLEKNNVEHGSVDSVIGIHFHVDPKEDRIVNYWITAAKTIPQARELNQLVKERGASAMIESSKNYWKAWLQTGHIDFQNLPGEYVELFNKSLLIVSAHTGGNGSIIASGDSDLLKQGRDAYAYVWARDGALIVRAMNKAGYHTMTRRFLEFCSQAITDEGFMLHKYRADGTLGSSWHPWVRNFKSELPIQEDETALVIIALWEYYQSTKNIEFVEKHYDRLIEQPANFMVRYINPHLGLPDPTYDLWEEKFGTSTFTASTVYGALICASKFAGLLGKIIQQDLFKNTAETIRENILKYLYNPDLGYFIKHLICNPMDQEPFEVPESLANEDSDPEVSSAQGGGRVAKHQKYEVIYDSTVDSSSAYGIYEYGVVDLDDPRLVSTVNKIRERITNFTEIQGVGRYEDDYYFRVSQETPGNPWIITTLWLARYDLHRAKTLEDLKPVYEWLDWVVRYAQPSGVLSEQINPYTGEQISASPLVWSHAEFVQTIIELLEKKSELA